MIGISIRRLVIFKMNTFSFISKSPRQNEKEIFMTGHMIRNIE